MSEDPWFKWRAKAINSAQLRLLAREDRWNFVAVCCIKRDGELDSGAPMLERRVAVRLELTAAEAVEVKRRLIEVGLIDDNWQPLSWADQQPALDNTATERQRRHRDRSRHGMSQTVTRDTRDSHATDIDKELEEEREKKEIPPNPPHGGRVHVFGLNIEAWTRWEQYRKEKRKPIKPGEEVQAAQKKLAGFGEFQAAVVQQSIEQGWTGLFALRKEFVAAQATRKDPYARAV